MITENPDRPLEEGNITPGHIRAYHALTSGLYDNISLASCSINGERGVAIIMLDQVGEDKVAIMPLFVAVTSSMKLVFQSQREGGSGGSKRPKQRYDELKEFGAPEPGGKS